MCTCEGSCVRCSFHVYMNLDYDLCVCVCHGSKRCHIGSGHCNGVEKGVDIHSKLRMAYCYGSREQRIAMA